MGELIKIEKTNGGQKAVNARELHQFLESKQRFADWIKSRIEKYGFVEGEDFVCFSEKYEKPKGGRPSTEYAITLDMAKELSMVENNEKGRQARRYFIQAEKEARQLPQVRERRECEMRIEKSQRNIKEIERQNELLEEQLELKKTLYKGLLLESELLEKRKRLYKELEEYDRLSECEKVFMPRG